MEHRCLAVWIVSTVVKLLRGVSGISQSVQDMQAAVDQHANLMVSRMEAAFVKWVSSSRSICTD
eukprot:2624046-Amphidinium_carterae.1